jgi:hypothetical protein
MNVGNVIGILAAGLVLISYVMKSMVPLRAIALASNVAFIAYGYIESLPPTVVLHCGLLLLNTRRLWEILDLVKQLKQSTQDTPISEWLLPHMTRRAFKAGDVLFHKGDPANEMVYIMSGQVRLHEYNQILGPGELVGEIGLFTPEKRRTQSIVCETDGQLYRMSDEMMYRLYYQNPKLGFYLMGLIVQRLLTDIKRGSSAPAT